jgi:hypothetical protein
MQFALSKPLLLAVTVTGALAAAHNASAALVVSEIDAAGSGNSAYGADWFELTNTGSSAISLSGDKMDDSHASFSAAVALTGVTSLAAGQTAVFIESTGTTAAAVNAAFESAWFGANVPAGLVLGNYSGSSVGLSQSGDGVNIYSSAGTLLTGVSFGASPSSGGTFDNTAGLSNVTLTQASVVGVNGAFKSVSGGEIGSPGIDGTPVPIPASAFLLIGGLGLFAPAVRNRRKPK